MERKTEAEEGLLEHLNHGKPLPWATFTHPFDLQSCS